MKKITMLSWFQIVELTSSSYIPLTFWLFPRTAVMYAGLDAPWAVLGVVLVGILTGLLQGVLNERFQTVTGADMARAVWGKWIGTASNVFYFPVYLLFNSMCIFFFAQVMKSFYVQTPRLVLIAALCFVAMRGAWLGVEALGRVASIVHPLTFAGVLVIFTIIMFQAKHVWLPHTVGSVRDTLRGVYYLLPIYLGFNVFLMLSPYYVHIKRKSVWYPVISAGIGGSAILVTFFAVIVNVGFDASKDLTFSIPFIIQLIRVRGGLVERVGILVLVFATAYTVLFVRNVLWALSTLSARIFFLPDGKYRRFVIPCGLMCAAVAASFRNEEQAFELLDKYLVPLSWILLIGVPLVSWLVAVVRRIRMRQPSAPDETIQNTRE